MSAKDFYVTQTEINNLSLASTDKDFDPELCKTYGCAVIAHYDDTRTDVLNYDLAFKLSLTHPGSPRSVLVDLEPHTRHLPTRSITFWENVGVEGVTE